MTHDERIPSDLLTLIEATCDGTIDETQAQELQTRLRSDACAREFYVDFVNLDSELQRLIGFQRQSETILQNLISEAEAPVASAGITFGADAFHGAVGYFASGWPMAYCIATVIFGVGLLLGAITNVSQPTRIIQYADSPLGNTTGTAIGQDADAVIVGRITGVVDCRWDQGAEDRDQWTENRKATRLSSPGHRPEGLAGGREVGGDGGSHLHSAVHLNDHFALRSGLLEITYTTGARVILQGPVSYKVDSAAGGFLGIGKLTARLEKKAETQNLPSPVYGRGAGGEGGSQHDTDSNHTQLQSALTLTLSRKRARGPDSPFPLHPSTFAVTTPTAVVTDLGTEFGVEVTRQGVETVVFSGTVNVSVLARRGHAPSDRVLHKGEAARIVVDPSNGIAGFNSNTATPVRFVRSLMSAPEMLIGPTVCNGSFESPAVGPKHFDPDAGNLNVGVYAIIHNVVPQYWDLTSSIQTKGTFVNGVLGEQYVVSARPNARSLDVF